MKQTNEAVKETAKNQTPEVRRAKSDELFNLVKKDNEIFITMGNYVISKRNFKSWQQAEDYLRQKPYEIIVNVACLCAEKIASNYEKDNKKTKAGK